MHNSLESGKGKHKRNRTTTPKHVSPSKSMNFKYCSARRSNALSEPPQRICEYPYGDVKLAGVRNFHPTYAHLKLFGFGRDNF